MSIDITPSTDGVILRADDGDTESLVVHRDADGRPYVAIMTASGDVRVFLHLIERAREKALRWQKERDELAGTVDGRPWDVSPDDLKAMGAALGAEWECKFARLVAAARYHHEEKCFVVRGNALQWKRERDNLAGTVELCCAPVEGGDLRDRVRAAGEAQRQTASLRAERDQLRALAHEAVDGWIGLAESEGTGEEGAYEMRAKLEALRTGPVTVEGEA